MPHIRLPDGVGIQAVLAYKASTARHLVGLIEEVLRGTGPLSHVERELIAARASERNRCEFCARTHAAAAALVTAGPVNGADGRVGALLALTDAVVRGGRDVTPDLVAAARREGLGDDEIHDTVLIAATFCMVNRYVDGLGADTPDDAGVYDAIGGYAARHGYLGLAPGTD